MLEASVVMKAFCLVAYFKNFLSSSNDNLQGNLYVIGLLFFMACWGLAYGPKNTSIMSDLLQLVSFHLPKTFHPMLVVPTMINIFHRFC
ncbi:hypothetical protein L1887_05620 [Cichorium endivia]|nr:hypothetical protein L1887_05620 [Cichorium endivia]